ncbi:MAG: hypothetical protein AAGI23_04445 [Bacteroidota bacterium]
MKTCNNNAINEAIELLYSLNASQQQSEAVNSVRVSDEIRVETIIEYLDRSKEIILKFKDLDNSSDGEAKVFKKRFWRKLLGHVLKAIGEFFIWLGNKLIKENP